MNVDSLDSLGITDLAALRRGLSKTSGLCLICSPSRSGKSTTLAAAREEVQRAGRICASLVEHLDSFDSLEEYERAVGALKRCDPDVVFTHIFSPQTARDAVEMAESGILVVATIPTNSIVGAVASLDMLEISQHRLLPILRAVLAQRLLRVYCQSCRGAGCAECSNTNYGGRTAVSECAYFASPRDVEAMLDGERQCPSMVEDGVEKALRGLTSFEEVTRIFGDLLGPILRKKGLV